MQYSKGTLMLEIDGKQSPYAMFHFICEGCGAVGDLGVPLDREGLIRCPENCGAIYILWYRPENNFALTCVVCPVFETPESGDGD